MCKVANVITGAMLVMVTEIAFLPPTAAQQTPAPLEPTWVLEDVEGYLYLDIRSGGELVYASTMDGRVQAVDASGNLNWSLSLNMSWPELACAPEGELWASDGLGLARINTAGDLVFSSSAFTGDAPAGSPAAAAYVDLETGLVYGISAAGERTWEGPRLAGEMRLITLLPDASGVFIVEENDFANAHQQFFGLDTDGAVTWSFDATAYGEMPIAGLYPVPRADGSMLLAPVTSSGEIGGKQGEYGTLLSLDSSGKLEWEYPKNTYLLSYHAAPDGAVDVVLPDYTIHRVGRDGRDRWVYSHGKGESLRDCLVLPDGGALVCFSWTDWQPLLMETVRAVRLSPDGAVVGEFLLSQPEDLYWYMVPLGDMLVCLDGDYRLVGFKLT